jgi:hypothetical protein
MEEEQRKKLSIAQARTHMRARGDSWFIVIAVGDGLFLSKTSLSNKSSILIDCGAMDVF